MMNKSTNFMMGGIFAGLMVIAVAGCKKDQQTIATITVVNADGEAVPGASVRLYAVSSETPPPPQEVRFDTTQVTNGTGKVSFDFTDYYEEGQAGFAVLDIEASKGSLEGEGIIKIEEMKTNEETVVIE
jgi:hypothetical protein